MAPRIDTSGLYQQAQQTPMSRFVLGVGGILEATMARRREAERQAILDQQKADELQFRRDQEQRLSGRQEMLDKREDARLQAQETRAQEDRRLKGYEAVGKAKPQDREFLAQLYGGTIGQGKADTTGIDFVQDSPARKVNVGGYDIEAPESPMGFTVNPEWEQRTAKAENTQTLTMPGGQPIELPGQDDEQDPYTSMGAAIALDPMHAALQRRLQLARAAGVDPKVALDELQEERQLAASERNARIVAGRQERASALADQRAAARDAAGEAKKLKAWEDRAVDSDRELAIQEALIKKNGGVPAMGQDRVLYDQSVKRLSGSLALAESGNPESEASDPTKRDIRERTSTGRVGAFLAPVAEFFGIETEGQEGPALKKIEAERQILRAKRNSRAQDQGLGPQGPQYGPVETKKLKTGETVRVRRNLSTGKLEEVQ